MELSETAQNRITEASKAMVSRLMHMSIGEFRSLRSFHMFSGHGDATIVGDHTIFGVELTTTPTGAFRSVKLTLKPNLEDVVNQHVDDLDAMGVIALANEHIIDPHMSEGTLAFSLELALTRVVERELERRRRNTQ